MNERTRTVTRPCHIQEKKGRVDLGRRSRLLKSTISSYMGLELIQAIGGRPNNVQQAASTALLAGTGLRTIVSSTCPL